MCSSFCGNFTEADRSDNRSAQVGEGDSKSESQVAANLDIGSAGDHGYFFYQNPQHTDRCTMLTRAEEQTSAKRLKNG